MVNHVISFNNLVNMGNFFPDNLNCLLFYGSDSNLHDLFLDYWCFDDYLLSIVDRHYLLDNFFYNLIDFDELRQNGF